MFFFKLLCVFVVFSLNAQVRGKIVARGKWGSAPGEFGLDRSELPEEGPNVFTVSPDGEVYVADPLNKRINVFKNGKFLKSIDMCKYTDRKYINDIYVSKESNLFFTDGNGLHVIDNLGEEVEFIPGISGGIIYNGDALLVGCSRMLPVFKFFDQVPKSEEVDTISGTGGGVVCMGIRGSRKRCIYKFDKKIKSLELIKETDADLVSKGYEYKRETEGSRLLEEKRGTACIVVNSKPVELKRKRPKIGKTKTIDSVQMFHFLDVDTLGNLYLFGGSGIIYQVKPDGMTRLVFSPTIDELQLIMNLPYDAPSFVKVINNKVYFMGITEDEFLILEFDIPDEELCAQMRGKIVVRGEWGSAPGEFGLDRSEPPGEGPNVFTVAPDGKVYVADPLNKRINVFKNGKFLEPIIMQEYANKYTGKEYINDIYVDKESNLFFTDDKGLHIVGSSGKEVTTIPRIRGGIMYNGDALLIGGRNNINVYDYNEGTKSLELIKETDAALVSKSYEYKRSNEVSKLLEQKRGTAHIVINGKAVELKKKDMKGEFNPIPLSELSFRFLGVDTFANIYLYTFDSSIYQINPKGVTKAVFSPTIDELQLIMNLPYDAPSFVKVINNKVYFMGAAEDEFLILEFDIPREN